ncbi:MULTISPECIES: hypothetical protein [Enterobacteriaceae]|uniref:hypothetical protein n=1 Tax=Enterobacteriaceae TaxID=543 RepID=UPI000B417799|nr:MULTISPECIES: hypothetical protein [Enterobacteriaceae]MBK5828931.1 hypothetical protein [Klebsiella pneumoniae]MCJ1876131.1 hypothetical protein [Klebsiella sp. HSTU-Sny5]MCP6585524.1 hypothetical protein [Klebsiella pneumoniae]MDT9828945.1 hypothetical protein [Klebsiella pneumoniae]OVX87244.1 hypothetical protein BME20_06050 [Klebsiella pneumoniae]
MKKWFEAQLERINLSHIRWMIIGVLLTELITWLLYKNPKKITAPGLSATVAVCALILALYSAYQVKKWVSGKVNEKGFKKCEAIIDKTQEIAMAVARIDSEIQGLHNMNLVILEATKYNEKVEKILKQREVITDAVLEIYTHEMHLKIWGFEISEKHSLNQLTDSIKPYKKAIDSTLGNSKKYYTIGSYKEAAVDGEQYKKGLRLMSAYIDKVNDSVFNEIFLPYCEK